MKIEFTGKVFAKQMSFLLEDDTLHTAYYTIIETVTGRRVTIVDKEAPKGMMEAETRYMAVKKGKEFLKRMNAI